MERETALPKDDPEVAIYRETEEVGISSKDGENEEEPESVVDGVSGSDTNEEEVGKNIDELSPNISCPELPKVLLQRILTDAHCPKPTEPAKKDGGFCWIIVIASFLSWFLFAGTRSSIGLIQEEFENRLKDSPTGLSWTGAMVNAIPLLLAPVISVLTRITSCGFLTSLGGVITFAGFLLVTFTDTVPLILVGLGLFPGLGLGLMALPSTFMVSDCFDSRRGLVIALSTAGGGLGFIVFPVLFSFMVNFYGLKGTLLVCSALYLNGFLFGIIYRQKEKQPKKIEKKSTFSEMKKTFCDKDVFCSYNFFPMIFSNMMFGASDTIPFLFIPSKAERLGFSLELSAMLISAIGFTSITGRIGIGILTGKSQCRRLGSFIAAFLISSVSMALYAFTERYVILIIGSCVFGVSTGRVHRMTRFM
ncbi:monocarboxylate transporter 13-like [Saccostrea echinata]|uniref:monocarboxylate transporter 13-like n=1 Tax=Saccostrea echinata TaxID=191078 RepID=UPI002A7F470D|nr:monocarboxylate transporter 13-like [Saccostrea echinata]